MNYNFTLITTVSDCDTLLSLANEDKESLSLRMQNITKQRKDYAGSAVEIDAELQAVTAELAILDTVIPGLPEGDYKTSNITRKKRLDLKKHLLTGRKQDYGVVAVLEKESDISRIEKEIEALDAFIAAINTRKAEL